MGSEGRAPVIRFYLTGFGKFYNVKDNPTEELMNRAMEFMKHRSLPFDATIESCNVLETAGAGCLDSLLQLLQSASFSDKEGGDVEYSGDRQEIVWLHFGVNSGASGFAVEQRAVNEATFRCPDEMGWQPEGEPIIAEDGAISNVRETTFPTSKIVSELVKEGFPSNVSNDAGRFVCNYVYYQSLAHAAKMNAAAPAAAGTIRSLFVHVPPFSVIDIETQMEFVNVLLKVLASLPF